MQVLSSPIDKPFFFFFQLLLVVLKKIPKEYGRLYTENTEHKQKMLKTPAIWLPSTADPGPLASYPSTVARATDIMAPAESTATHLEHGDDKVGLF